MNIAVTGIGIISAIGNNADEVYTSLREKKTGIAKMRYLQSSHAELPVGEVKLSNEELCQLLCIEYDETISRTTLLGSIAVKQALQNAGYLNNDGTILDSVKSKRIALISGTTVGGMDITETFFKRMQSDDRALGVLKNHDCGSNTNEIARLCDIDATCCTISTACSSAVNSIIVGSEMLRNNEVDIVIAGGTEALSKFHLNGFNTLMILDKEQCRPFDETRAGLNLGEGAAFIVLEKDVEGVAYIGGYANACDAFHQTASSEDGEGAYLAMQGALTMSGLNPKEVEYVNAHGTGTPNNDVSEGVAMKRIFGSYMPAISSTKSFTGHTTSASGSIETVVCILALQNQFIPANLNWKNQIEGGITPSMGEDKYNINNVLCNSFGFGGNDSSLLISRKPVDIAVTEKKNECEIVADVVIDNAEQLTELKEFVKPMESRRMGKLLKAATLSSLRALKEGNVQVPDAIITGTTYGMLETSEKFLRDMCENAEESLSPTLFMQSTHNTIGSAIAIRTKCHGYNITYTQGKESMEWAIRDARRLIESGKADSVLVGCHDEATPLFQELCDKVGMDVPQSIYSRSVLMMKKR